MRRPAMRIGVIATMLAGMMGAGAQSQGANVDPSYAKEVKIGARKEKKQQIGTGRHWRSWGHPAAPENQRQFRKKWRMSPHYRPKANKS